MPTDAKAHTMHLLLAPVLLLGAAQEILCPGSYGGHLQGIATSPAHDSIYWSFTVALVKTDPDGNITAKVDAPSHQGDLTVLDDKLYVAVNLGAFNLEPGKADSWVYVYDTKDLALLAKHPVPEAVHGAGGITWNGEVFVVVGGLPLKYEANHIFLYDRDFKFLGQRDLATGYTKMGIQTACFLNGEYWFGTYHKEQALLRADPAFQLKARYDVDGEWGIAPWNDGTVLLGVSELGDAPRTYRGKALLSTLPKP